MIRNILILTSLLLFLTCSHHHDYEVPDFTLPDVLGNQVNLYSLLDQGPVVLISWALWCKISMKEIDALKPYTSQLYTSKDICFVIIGRDKGAAVSNMLHTAIKRGWIWYYRVLSDTADIFFDLYDIQNLPTTIAVNHNGEIVFTWVGYRAGDELLIVDTLKALFGR